MRQLEMAHHFCHKHSQGLQCDTISNVVKGMLGIISIEAYIDKQKLAFFGSVFRTPPTDLVNRLITYRLFYYSMRITDKHFGFIPDIHRIMTKYNLLYYFDQAITTSTFPAKFQWKRVCSQTIHRCEQEQCYIRMSLNTDFT